MSWFVTTCRGCLADTLQDLFEFSAPCYFTPDGLTFLEVFKICTTLQINDHDGLPQRICHKCVKDMQRVYDFQQKVLKTDDELNKLKNIYQTKEYRRDFIKDPLENVTDVDDSDEEENCTSNVTNGRSDDNKKEGAYNEIVGNSCYNDYIRIEDFPLHTPLVASASDSDDKDNDFLESVETQIFPQGRYVCKVCKKAYFTNIGLQAHMDIHKPKRKIHNHKESPKIKSDTRSERSSRPVNKQTLNTIYEKDKGLNDGNPEEVLTLENNIDILRKPKKTFPCNVCGKQMISVSKLRYHMVMHTGEKDFLCTMCPKAYSTIYALKHHMRAHTGERPYECKFCGDRFLRPTTLKSHMRRHTGERPYGCDICGKRFIQHSSMATHIKLNHMDKTITCPYCDKKYARQTDLNTHLLSHSGDKPFACKMCPSRFTRQSNLNKHMHQQHQNESSEELDGGIKGNRNKSTEVQNAHIAKNKTNETLRRSTVLRDKAETYVGSIYGKVSSPL